ncbi:MAG: RecB-family nuclease [Ignisphaera sp.]
MSKAIYLVAYAPSSPHRLQDLAKLAFSMNFITAFIVVKPVGVAAQLGVPEVFRLAYKLDRRFLVFPRLQDLKELINVDLMLFVVHFDEAPDLCEINITESGSIALIVQSGETPFIKEDIALGKSARLSEVDGYKSPNPVADAAIALVKLRNILKKGSC